MLGPGSDWVKNVEAPFILHRLPNECDGRVLGERKRRGGYHVTSGDDNPRFLQVFFFLFQLDLLFRTKSILRAGVIEPQLRLLALPTLQGSSRRGNSPRKGSMRRAGSQIRTSLPSSSQLCLVHRFSRLGQMLAGAPSLH